MQPGETEIAVRGEGPGEKACDAVLLSPSVTTLAGVNAICALAQRLRQIPSPGQLAAVFDDGRRIEGNLVSGWRGSGTQIARDGAARPRGALPAAGRSGRGPGPPRRPRPVLEFHNGDRMRGTLCGYVAASTQAGGQTGVGVAPACWCSLLWISANPRRSRSPSKSIGCGGSYSTAAAAPGAPYPAGGCPPRSLVCRDGRVIAFRALRFSGDGVSVLTDQGLVRLAYRDLAEVAMPPIDAWEAYYRQLAVIDPTGDAGIVRLETGQGMVLTASTTGSRRFAMMRKRPHRRASSAGLEPHADPRRLVGGAHVVAGPRHGRSALALRAAEGRAGRRPGQQLEVASGPQRGRRRASQRRRPLSLGFWRPCAQRIGLPLCPTPRGPSAAAWASMPP